VIRSNGPLVEIQGDNEGEAISSQGGFASSYKSGSMRSLLDTEVNRERGREGREGGRGEREGGEGGEIIRISNWLPGTKVQSWPKLAWVEGTRKAAANYAHIGVLFTT